MISLIKNTTAYKILEGDRRAGKLSHAYMLDFNDSKNLRAALKLFALEFYGEQPGSAVGARILKESFTDFTVYPAEGKKITTEGIVEIIEDSALRPVEGAKKLYVICGFDAASALIQNKLLKTLEEPLAGVHFLLGVTTLAPVLDTVRSRVKLLEIPPFPESEILAALERQGHKDINALAAKSANGVLGVAENVASGDWFQEVLIAAKDICSASRIDDIGAVAAKYGEIKYKAELLSEMQRLYFTALTEGGELSRIWSKPALVFALEKINAANADVKFNAFFQGLLYDFMLEVVEENDKWLKLQV